MNGYLSLENDKNGMVSQSEVIKGTISGTKEVILYIHMNVCIVCKYVCMDYYTTFS